VIDNTHYYLLINERIYEKKTNGVIVITTKRGSKYTAKPVITFSTDISAQPLSRKYKHQDVYAQGR